MTIETMTPAERWNLREDARVTVNGTEYVIYSDECYAWAIEAEAFDRPTEEDDYSEWCVGDGSGVGDDELCQAIADASGRLIYTAGAATPVKPQAETAATLNEAYRARIAKKYSNPWGNRFARVEIVEKATGRVVAFEDVLVRSGFKGTEETRAGAIKAAAVETILRVAAAA